ncbi:MAG: intermembrane transport protein PqiB [Myxococcota bacterium]
MSENHSDSSDSNDAGGMPAVVVTNKARPSSVWLIPLIAAAVGIYLAYWAWSEQGPEVTISFESAEGLEAGKTKLRYKEVEVGQIESVKLNEDLSSVIVTASLVKGFSNYLTENTRFWAVRARVSAGEISGLETVLSGVYIAVDPSKDGRRTRTFEGLEKAPIVTSDKPGTLFHLRAEELGSVEVGSPVYYRWLRVGVVAGYELSESGEQVDVQVFVEEPHDQRVRSTTRFWNASGLDAVISAEGIQVDSPSLITMLVGGVAFETPATVTVARDVPEDMIFELYSNKQETRRPRYSVKSRFLMYFEESVAGLAQGSPVEFRGIKIGEVLDVDVRLDQETNEIEIPVVVEIEPERLGIDPNADDEGEIERMGVQVQRGLRARLQTANLLTGQKSIDLDFLEDPEPATILMGSTYPILPTAKGGLDAITQRVARIVDKVDRVPIESIGRNLEGVLEGLAGTLGEMESLAGSANADVLPGITASLAKLEETLASADTLIAPDSSMAREIETLVVDLAEAARSIRMLAERLEEHPEELLRGKKE